MYSNIAMSFSLVSGFMACLLFILGMHFEKDKKRSKFILIWACFFLGASFANMEWAFWIEGDNIFTVFFNGNFPVVGYFLIWFSFIVWLFERRRERKIWIILLILLILISIYAMINTNIIGV